MIKKPKNKKGEVYNVNNVLQTFTIHETDKSLASSITKKLFIYKHLENLLNLILQELILKINHKDIIKEEKDKLNDILKKFLNPITMKAVLSHNLGSDKTKHNIKKINDYFEKHQLFIEAKSLFIHLNAHNISMVVRRLHKDWNNYFSTLKEFNKNNKNKLNTINKPSYPKAKKLSKVFTYSIPLEVSKFSLSKIQDGLLGINLEKKMFYVYIGKDKDVKYYENKVINNVTISYSHGHIYYQLTYIKPSLLNHNKDLNEDHKEVLNKEAGLDVGINNLFAIFINDQTSKSLIMSGKSVISYNVNFNKRLSKINTQIKNEVKTTKQITDKNNKTYQVPESYTQQGKALIYRRNQLYERRKLFFNDCYQKSSKKVLEYLKLNNVNKLVISKNLNFTKTTGEIKMQKSSKQKFYQIPFGMFLNLIESKCSNYGIEVININEAYTSKTSSISADINAVQSKSRLFNINNNNIEEKERIELIPNDLKGNRGVSKKKTTGNTEMKLLKSNKGKSNKKKYKKGIRGRGLFLDTEIKKVINADLNGACNHIKIHLKDKSKEMIDLIQPKSHLFKWCNPIKIKSNDEFDKVLKILKSNN